MSMMPAWRATVLALALVAQARAADPPEFSVGAAAPCDFQSLATAVGAVPDGSIIRIASNQSYDDINLAIDNRSLTLQGGYADCLGTTGPPPTLRGDVLAILPVLRIGSAVAARHVLLRRLRIEGGRRSGIELTGRVSLELDRIVLDGNTAANGGGLAIDGASQGATQVELVNTIIGNDDVEPGSGNHADANGGGISCRRARITLNGAAIRNNSAAQSGGGLHLDQCLVDTGLNTFQATPGERITALIADNRSATLGGGIHAVGTSVIEFGPASALLSIRTNASGSGGGAYLAGAGTRLDGVGMSIDGNVADLRGGAATLVSGASLSLRRGPIIAAAAVHGGPQLFYACTPPVECNLVRANRAGTFTGGAFHVTDGVLALAQARVSGNSSANGSIILLVASIARVEHVLIDGNDSHGGDLVRLIDGSNLAFVGSTLAGNIAGPALVRTFSDGGANNLFLRAGIVWQPGTTVLATTPIDTVQSACMNTHDIVSIAGSDHPPGFVDAAAGDYRLSSNSPNVDACADPFPTASVDLLGVPRPTDLGERPGDGDFDRGAYELPDRLFASDMGEIPEFLAAVPMQSSPPATAIR